jgi:hypothetical protein
MGVLRNREQIKNTIGSPKWKENVTNSELTMLTSFAAGGPAGVA